MKQVNIAEFKAHLGQYLRTVREGGRVELADRGTPVAMVVPYEAARPIPFQVEQPTEDPAGLATMRFERLPEATLESLSLLLEERRDQR